ncbi:MAG: C10 family peptidase, partial [Edaphocola sp.]
IPTRPNNHEFLLADDGIEGGGCTSTNVVAGPLMATQWGQGCGYNDNTPVCGTGQNCGHTLTGCVATAMAQVLKYWSHPVTGINYAAMNDIGSTTATAHLMSLCGTSLPSISYGCSGTYASASDVPNALINNFGMATASYMPGWFPAFYSTIFTELDNGRPILLNGCSVEYTSTFLFWTYVTGYDKCHEWVCDGYRKTGDECHPQLYLHMNWGWNGNHNDWYYYDDWDIPAESLNFQYAHSYIFNIHP